MPYSNPEHKRARDRQRHHQERAAGACRPRRVDWRDVNRAWDSFMQLPGVVQDHVLTAART